MSHGVRPHHCCVCRSLLRIGIRGLLRRRRQWGRRHSSNNSDHHVCCRELFPEFDLHESDVSLYANSEWDWQL